MPRKLIVEFTKMQGAGNDFVVVDNRWYRFSDEELADLAARWCERRYGVGADGLLAFAEAETEGADYRMRYVNADGSWATMCGNGARCLARYAVQSDVEGPEVAFDTDAGRYHARVGEDPGDPVRLYVPPERDLRRDVTLDDTLPAGLEEAATGIHSVWTGTPHLVVFVDDAGALSGDDLVRWGRHLRRDPALEPEGANANFVSVEETDAGTELRVRTYEKGVEGETLSCGTGVLAAAAVARSLGRAGGDGEAVRVHTRGGTQTVGVEETSRGRELYLEGPVESVFRGTLEV
jgi:diaminopimelate epimerase